MFGDRTPPEEARSRPESRRSVRPLPLTLVTLLVTLVLLVLGICRREESTLEPPF